MFISLILAAAMAQATVADGARKAFSACLKSAEQSAKAEKIAADAFEAYAHQKCAAAESSFKSGLAGFNRKNGMSSKAAAEDAQLQIDDYVFSATERYEFAVEDPGALN